MKKKLIKYKLINVSIHLPWFFNNRKNNQFNNRSFNNRKFSALYNDKHFFFKLVCLCQLSSGWPSLNSLQGTYFLSFSLLSSGWLALSVSYPHPHPPPPHPTTPATTHTQIQNLHRNLWHRNAVLCLVVHHVWLFVTPWRPLARLSMGTLQERITGVGFHALLQGIFPTQGSNPCHPNWKWILYHLSHQGSPRNWSG